MIYCIHYGIDGESNLFSAYRELPRGARQQRKTAKYTPEPHTDM